MPKGTDDKKGKIGSIKSTTVSGAIERTGSVSEVEGAKKASAVSGVRGAGSIGGLRATQGLTAAKRAELYHMIEEEADKLFSSDKSPKHQKEVVEKAVKMTVDAAMAEEEEEKDKDGKNKKK
jgi:hypothetical protein